ncbi:hypothetical protein COD19_02050 [Bacillus cereus]|uniref:Uncharacterized protein n=1 Tax=Bacillus cereus TaxID=1396 RepID=A0A2C1MA82_BACCE|nr:hypothetical protein COD19_02050 [Bacillus cereus]
MLDTCSGIDEDLKCCSGVNNPFARFEGAVFFFVKCRVKCIFLKFVLKFQISRSIIYIFKDLKMYMILLKRKNNQWRYWNGKRNATI